MKPGSVSNADLPELSFAPTGTAKAAGSQSFDKVLQEASAQISAKKLMSEAQPIQQTTGTQSATSATQAVVSASETVQSQSPSKEKVAATYRQALKAARSNATVQAASKKKAAQSADPAAQAKMSGFAMYKDDQLLRNPGGRNYYLDQKKVIENSPDQASLFKRVGKTFSAVVGNLKNFTGNLLMGSKFLYRDERNNIQEGKTRGLLGATTDFVKDLTSALTLGAYRPDKTEAPQGAWNRICYSASKLKDAILGDLITKVPSSINHMAQNLALAGWHLAQVAPDATIGNLKTGRALTTSIFDNGHVMVEYITDVIPTGDAWLRVHGADLRHFQLPVLYNLKMPEHFNGDARWQYVRNTPFRKTIETIGSLLADGAGYYLTSQTGTSSNRNQKIP